MVVSLKAFRDRYPTATLISELLMVKDDQFVVKVTIETPSSGISTGLSSSSNLELAEDQARQRALQGLGLADNRVAETATPEQSFPAAQSSRLADSHPNDQFPNDQFSDEHLDTGNGIQQEAEKPIVGKPSPPVKSSSSVVDSSIPKPTSQVSKPKKPETSHEEASDISGLGQTDSLLEEVAHSASKSAPIEDSEVDISTAVDTEAEIPAAIDSEADPNILLPAPINLSDVIAQTDIELSRLGWSVEVGRDHLWKTYNKRSRHELSEEELIEFLCFLESQSDEI